MTDTPANDGWVTVDSAPTPQPGTNTGHGHAWPRPDGLRARCGGPAVCRRCATDQAAVAATRTPRPSVHDPLSKSYAIDQITDVEQLRAVAHHMWEAFSASHKQAAHVIGVLIGDTECAPCTAAFHGHGEACEQWHQWQAKVHDGFGSV